MLEPHVPRALRALVPYVLSCLTCLVLHVLSCPTCLVPYVCSKRALVPYKPLALRASCLTSLALRALVPHVS